MSQAVGGCSLTRLQRRPLSLLSDARPSIPQIAPIWTIDEDEASEAPRDRRTYATQPDGGPVVERSPGWVPGGAKTAGWNSRETIVE